jgi:nucleoside-diphosphate-sugar epimerase
MTAMRALIGYSGFIGGNVAGQWPFDALFNSSNIDELRGGDFDEIVCAAPAAEKWKANADPESDARSIARLETALSETKARRFILISTIDVYPRPRDVDEGMELGDAGEPYGRHRLRLESFIRERFADAIVLRLPGLFGPGLKKNALFDLIHDHQVERIDGRGIFQFYDVGNLRQDIERCIARDIRLLNVATEPLRIADVARDLFGRELAIGSGEPPRYDVRTIHAASWNRDDGYLYGRDEVMAQMKDFIEAQR